MEPLLFAFQRIVMGQIGLPIGGLFLAKKTGIAEQIDVEEKPSDWKTNSQRLRNTLYVYWEQVNKHGYKFFNDYYQAWLEKKIEEIKEKLPDQK